MAALMRALFAARPSKQSLSCVCAHCVFYRRVRHSSHSRCGAAVSAEAQWQRPEALIVAKQPDAPMLDIGVVLFDPGVAPEDDSPRPQCVDLKPLC